jgi:creatinine amidohydrolase
MATTRLSRHTDDSSGSAALAWAHLPTTAFADIARRPGALALLPVHGHADHGLGLPLDAEEQLAAPLLAAATATTATAATATAIVAAAATATASVCVLPPFRFGPAPYPCCFFGIDPDTARDALLELADGVRRAGFEKLLLFSTCPWHREWLNAAALDIRVETGLRVYRLHLSALDLDFHPAAPETRRIAAQSLVSWLSGSAPEPVTRAGDVSDATFRPGCFRQPPPLSADNIASVPDAPGLFAAATARLAALLAELSPPPPPPPPLPGHHPATPVPVRTPDSGHQTPPGYYLPSLTRDRLEAIAPADRARAIVILPTGAIEQHGPHLPVGTDALIGQALPARALDRLHSALPSPSLPPPPVYVAPPLLVGKSTEHRSFAGTLTHSTRTFRSLLRAQAAQLHRLGFRTLAILNTHGGNSAVLTYTLRELQTDPALPGLRAGMLTHGYKPAELSAREAAFGFHAGEWETSLMLAIAPDLVRMDRALCAWPARLDDPGTLRPEGAPLTFAWATEDISPTGVMGDATRATPGKGVRWLAAAADCLAAAIRNLPGILSEPGINR